MRFAHSLLLSSLALTSSFSFAQSFTLPIWKEEAQALGYELPKPIGFNLSYMALEQNIDVNSIDLKELPIWVPELDMQAEQGSQTSEVLTLRADMWLFPFLNLYVLGGKMTGTSETAVNVHNKFLGDYRIDNFKLDLDGYLYGGGVVLAGGYKQIFGLVDISYTETELTVIDGSISAWVISPRLGYDFYQQGLPLRVWGGAMYQNVEQSLSGKLSDLNLPPFIENIAKNGTFHIEQQLSTPWNPILGMQYQINPSLYLLAEAGFGDRTSLFTSIDFRF
ncbi:TonB-dependent receptor [Photobacterium leiognathi]|uniref:TonB-dependent receptor n=1 Tax=Photobacterium leiognathi TaxID=553611 RepID=UPI001EE0A3A3|nr:TonB-dependent receptor [Photobacterium leiognathi]MCG3885055.1 TonB-dependent receptor [Photobacterium leiognathi]